MQHLTDDVRITRIAEVRPPAELINELPLAPEHSTLVFNVRRKVSDIIAGRDPRLLVVVGPCSIHDPEAAREYAGRMKEKADTLTSELLVVMRVYFEKPRTTVGWKGLINDPGLDDSFDINAGLVAARALLRHIVGLGLGVGTEYLDPITPQYVGDLVCWAAIGARTTESQIHRQLASGLSCPTGFKNSTRGDIQVAVDAVKSAAHRHIFLSVTKAGLSAIFSTTGNRDCHIILRGGGGRTNFDNPSVHYASRILEQHDLGSRLMIDTSQANSRNDHQHQITVCENVAQQIADGESKIMGVLIESNLVAGRQSLPANTADLVYGQSITDPCIGWDDTAACLDELAAAVAIRNKS